MKLVLLGPPGAGKGTLATEIVNEYHIPHISTGDIFRENIKNGTPLGKIAEGYISKGQLVPDEVVIDIALDRLSKEDCKDSFMLDGFPRTVEQAKALDKFLSERGTKLSFVIDITVAKDVLIDRITTRRVCKSCGATYNIKGLPPKVEGICDKCGGELYQRADDNEETVAKRIDIYNTQTKPLVDYYQDLGEIVKLDGAVKVTEVYKTAREILGKQK